jgi:iron complex transport system ATP-binding protein
VKLEARALAFGYRKHPVGRNVSVALAAGEIMCLLGPNGGGKTTLFRTLLGLLPAQGGQVTLDGVDLRALPRREVAKRIAYVPQAHIGYFPFTVRDVVLMGRTAHLAAFAGPSRRDRALAEEALARLGLARLADSVYTQISGGERQLTLIARALAQAAPLLVMDEPTASLDFGNQVRVLDQVTHDPDQAFQCADRVALLRGGDLIAQGAPEAVLTREHLRELYGVEVEVTEVSLADGARRRVCLTASGR